MIDKKKLVNCIPQDFREPLKSFLQELLSNLYYVRCLINRIFFFGNLLSRKKYLHLGCGDIRIGNCLNIDYRATKATDLVHDCGNLSLFKDRQFKSVYSHAFFEHLYRDKRIPLLMEVKRVLDEKGYALFLGLPDFERIVTAYLNKEKGLFSETFDLYEVYRYTHGDPERYPSWWLQQLHKSLLDSTELSVLLPQGGFKHFLIFRYCFRNEHLPVSMGFYAWVSEGIKITAKDLPEIIGKYTDNVNIKSLEILKIK